MEQKFFNHEELFASLSAYEHIALIDKLDINVARQ